MPCYLKVICGSAILSGESSLLCYAKSIGADILTLYRIEDVNKHCLTEFTKHWTCLDNNNQQLWQCRPLEWKLNKCVFDNLV